MHDQFENFFTQDVAEGASMGLLCLMTGISEESQCAAWLSGLEYDLWDAAKDPLYRPGYLTERQRLLLRTLSEEAGGWWRYDNEQGPVFVTLDEWKTIISAVKSAGANKGL